MQEKRRGMLVVVSGPSGTGKGTLCNMLLEKDPSLRFSVSVTTRKRRDYEVEGVHYYFVTDEQYDELLREDALLEHATVHANRYGTPRKPIEELMEKGLNVILDIDPQGARTVISKCPDCVSIFILPPSMKALRERLTGRGTESAEDVERRLHNAVWEISQKDKYEYKVINDDLESCLRTLQAIIQAEKHSSAYYSVDID